MANSIARRQPAITFILSCRIKREATSKVRKNESHAYDWFHGIDELVWYQKGRHERAIADFNQAIKLDPSFAAAYLNRGLILHRNKEFNAAIAAVYPAIRVDPKIFDVNRRANMRPRGELHC